MEIQVRSEAGPYEILGGKSGAGTGFFAQYLGCLVSVSLQQCSVHHLVTTVYHKVKRENPAKLQSSSPRKSGSVGQSRTLTLFQASGG
jgi:hypothetical protein